MNMQHQWLGLENKVCVVTGAGSGIGAAIAAEAAAVGAHVVLLDRDLNNAEKEAAQLRDKGYKASAYECNVADEASVNAVAARVEKEVGLCTALVNNAGILRAGKLEDIPVNDWNQILSVNLTGYLLVSRAFARHMKQSGGGSIVHVSSIAALFPQSNSGAYSASKAGVLLMSRQMAVEWRQDNIRSNAVCPGMIRTSLSASFYAHPGIEEKRAAMTASRRIGEPEDIANAALFLLSDRSSYVNAEEINVNGGMNAMLMDMVPRPGYNA